MKMKKMDRITLALGLLVLLAAATIPAQAAEPESRPVQTGTGHPFACVDITDGKVCIVSPEGRVEWEYKTPGCNDLWALPNGNLLFNIDHGVREVTRAKETVFQYASASEIHGCQRLADGNTLVGECTAGRLLEIDPSGKSVFELRLLPEGTDGGHNYMRNVRKLANGNYLVCHYALEVVREYDAKGTVVSEIAAPGGARSAARLPNGNTVVTCGDLKKASMILEADKDGKTVWKIEHDELPGVSLKLAAGFQRLPNGNTVLANFLGHGALGAAPHLIEVTPDKKVIWTFQDHDTMKTISSVQLLDVPGDATRGEIIH
jgi:hypothetical protein